MSRLSRLPSLSPVGCQHTYSCKFDRNLPVWCQDFRPYGHTAASLAKTSLFDVKIVKTSVLKPCRFPTYSCKFDKKHPCLMSRLSRLPSLSPVGCQHTYSCKFDRNLPVWCQDFRPYGHTAASLAKTSLFDVKIVKTSVLKPCRLPTYSCKFDKNTPVWCQDCQDFRP